MKKDEYVGEFSRGEPWDNLLGTVSGSWWEGRKANVSLATYRRWFWMLWSSSLFWIWFVNLLVWERTSVLKSFRWCCVPASLILPGIRSYKAPSLCCFVPQMRNENELWIFSFTKSLLCKPPWGPSSLRCLSQRHSGPAYNNTWKAIRSWLQSWENAIEGLPSMHNAKFSKLCSLSFPFSGSHMETGFSPSCCSSEDTY